MTTKMKPHNAAKLGKNQPQKLELKPSDFSNETDVEEVVLSKVGNHQDKKTKWGAVTEALIRSTPVWKKFTDPRGNVLPQYEKKNVILAVLYYLGLDMNYSGKKLYSIVEQIVRYNHNKCVGIKTKVYTFPIRKDFAFVDLYLDGRIVTAPDKYAEEINLESFGSNFVEEVDDKPKKRLTKEQEFDQIIENGRKNNPL